MNKKVLLVFLLIVSISIIPINSFAVGAAEKQISKISLRDACSKALDANNDLIMNDKNIYDMLKGYGAPKLTHDRTKYNMENEFTRLYETMKSGKFLQSYEQGELVMYYATFKDSEIFKNKSLSPTINPNEFPNCDIWVSMMQMKIRNEILRVGTVDNVKRLYDSLLSINDNINIMTESNRILDLDYKEADLNFKNGKISELQRTKISNNYEIQKLRLNKLKRNKENIERSLKNVLGLNLNDDIQIIPYKVSEYELVIPSYQDCIKKALLNRNEISLVKMNLLANQIQLPILDNYVWNMPKIESFKMMKQETLLRVDELQDEIVAQEEFVTRAINTAYADVNYQKETLAIESLKLESAQKDLDKANFQYKSGQVSYKTLTNVKIAFDTSKASYESALRELAFRINKLNNSCGVAG